MFKAKIIEKQEYYKIRRKVTLAGFLAIFVVGFLHNMFLFHLGFLVIYLALAVSIVVYLIKLRKELISVSPVNHIEIDNNKIRIVGKKGSVKNEIQISEVQEIKLKSSLSIQDENLNSLFAEMKGKAFKNQISIKTEHGIEKFDFILDSHYMIEQLKKVIKSWKEQGIDVTT
ncbi:MAG: hypothetical protein U9R19_17565 [Bacteroidota bacterium]|nr:hypothetical protein [Bacteroidota bacterium]